jgi:hypothetical protein
MKSLFLALFLFSACSDSSDRVEVLSKLRTLGVKSSPSFVPQPTAPGTAVSIEFFVAVPKDRVITAESYDISKSEPLSFVVTPDPNTITYEEIGDLRIAKITGTGVLPPTTAAIDFKGVSSFGIKYGLTIKEGGESENIIGSILVFKEGASPAPSGLGVTINDSLDFTSKSEGSLAGTLQNPTSERFKISWFVSSGEIKNRRALVTKWTPEKSGSQALILTARGLNTGSFAISTKSITVK